MSEESIGQSLVADVGHDCCFMGGLDGVQYSSPCWETAYTRRPTRHRLVCPTPGSATNHEKPSTD